MAIISIDLYDISYYLITIITVDYLIVLLNVAE